MAVGNNESSDEIAKAAGERWNNSTSLAVSSLFDSFKKDYFERELYVLRNSIVDGLLENMDLSGGDGGLDPKALYISTSISIVKFNSGNHSSHSDHKNGNGHDEEEDEDFFEDEDDDKLNDMNSTNTSPSKRRNSRTIRPFSARRVIPSSFTSFSTPSIITNLNSPSKSFNMRSPHHSSKKTIKEDDIEGCFVAIVPNYFHTFSDLLNSVLNSHCLSDIFNSAENSVRRCAIIVTNANPEGFYI